MSETDKGRPDMARDALPAPGEAVPAAPKPGRQPRLFRTFVGIGIAVLLIGGAGLGLSQLHLFGDPRQAAMAAELAALRGELQGVNARLAAMEQAGAITKSDTLPGDVASRIQTLDSRLAAVETQSARAADRDTLTALQDRLARLEKDTAGVMLHRAATILAVANLARAAESGSAFERELGALRTLAPDDPAVVALEPLTAGVPSTAMLVGSFPDAARAAIQSEADEAAGRNPIGRLWANLRRLVSVRRIANAEGSTNADRLARAQADLDRSNLAAAVAEVSAVSGPAATSIARWLKNAQARLTAEAGIADMNRRVAQDLVLP